MKITSIQFFQAWQETVKSRENALKSIWRNKSEFTAAVRHNENSILQEIKVKLDLELYAGDYYSLDAILYHKDDLIKNRPQNTIWVTGIAVAFEHENEFTSGLYKEVSHLLITNCDLKVLVTYPPNDIVEKRELANLLSIIKGSRHSHECSQREDLLLIFGYEHDLSWHGLVYKEEDWKHIGVVH